MAAVLPAATRVFSPGGSEGTSVSQRHPLSLADSPFCGLYLSADLRSDTCPGRSCWARRVTPIQQMWKLSPGPRPAAGFHRALLCGEAGLSLGGGCSPKVSRVGPPDATHRGLLVAWARGRISLGVLCLPGFGDLLLLLLLILFIGLLCCLSSCHVGSSSGSGSHCQLLSTCCRQRDSGR